MKRGLHLHLGHGAAHRLPAETDLIRWNNLS
jgi:hypothetical protein